MCELGRSRVVRGIEADEVGRLPLERLEAEICRLAAQKAAAMARWLVLVAEFDRRRACEQWGLMTTAAWVAWKCGIEPRTARDHVRVATALQRLPRVAAAFASGELSYAKVRAVTRVAVPDDAGEVELVDFARVTTAAQLEEALRACRRADRPDDDDAAAHRRARRGVVHRYDDDGLGITTARLAPEDDAMLRAALDKACADLETDSQGADDRSEGSLSPENGSAEPFSGDKRAPRPVLVDPERFARRRADALVVLAETYLAHGAVADSAPADRYLAVVHTPIDVLSGGATTTAPHMERGPAIPAATLQRLCCDANLLAVIEDRDGNPLYLGRKTRVPSAAQDRALRIRDRGRCRWPGCTCRLRLQAHHVRWWHRDQGRTDIDNLLLLCPRHHRLVHEGRFRIDALGGQRFQFVRPDDTVIPESPEPETTRPGITEPLATIEADHADLGIDVAPEMAGGEGGRMDLGYAVDGLLCLIHPTPNSRRGRALAHADVDLGDDDEERGGDAGESEVA